MLCALQSLPDVFVNEEDEVSDLDLLFFGYVIWPAIIQQRRDGRLQVCVISLVEGRDQLRLSSAVLYQAVKTDLSCTYTVPLRQFASSLSPAAVQPSASGG
jgi:hypothetical protein